jgi:hypothetical protein
MKKYCQVASEPTSPFPQLMTTAFIPTGQKPDEYPKLLESAVIEAHNEFMMGRLFLPVDVANQVVGFFQLVYKGQSQFSLARHPMIPNGQERAKFWDEAGKIAHQEIPALLRTIEEQARSIIYGEHNR